MGDTKAGVGDVVCIEQGGVFHNPALVTSSHEAAPHGFVITAYAGYSLTHIIKHASIFYEGHTYWVSLWRKLDNIKPREYRPSLWATPVPLP